MTTDVTLIRKNCIAPAIALIVWTTNTKNKCARERAESPYAGTVAMIVCVCPRAPPPAPQPRVFPPPLPSLPSPLRPSVRHRIHREGRPARRAERRRRSRGPALLRRSERRFCRRGSACPAPLAPPACRRARSFRGRHALGRAGTAPTCVPSARRAARVLLLRSTSALFLRDAHAPVVVQIAICESERMSTSSPGRTRCW